MLAVLNQFCTGASHWSPGWYKSVTLSISWFSAWLHTKGIVWCP